MFDFVVYHYWRWRFKAQYRQDFYRTLAMQISIDVPPLRACDAIYEAYGPRVTPTEADRLKGDEHIKAMQANAKRDRPKNIVALVAQDCATGISNGIKLSEKLRRWVPYAEHATVAAGATVGAGGDTSASLAGALLRAVELIEYKDLIGDAIVKHVAYPMSLLVGAYSTTCFLALYVMPKLEVLSIKPGEAFNPSLSEQIAALFATYGGPVGIVIVLLGIAVMFSLGRLTGRARIALDRYVPFNLYRIATGANWLYNVGVYSESGMQYREALEDMKSGANPYLLERLNGIQQALGQGRDLGTACFLAGYEFPGRDAVAFISVVGSIAGSGNEISKLGRTWTTRAIKQIESGGKIFKNIAYVLFGLVVWMLLSAFNDMSGDLLKSFGAM